MSTTSLKSHRLVFSKINEYCFWLYSPGHFQGLFWIVLVSLISCMNDVFARFVVDSIDSKEIAFFRFFFSMITILPIMLYYGKSAFVTARPFLHSIRALLGFVAVALWCHGIGKVPLAIVSTVALTVPLFVLPLARWLLNDPLGWQRIVATVIGFIGIAIIAFPKSLNIGVCILLSASLLFAFSDILNKKMIEHETSLSMLFYFSLGTSLIGFFPMLSVWKTPTIQELGYLFMLGIGANLILYCILKACAAIELSALAPYRYLELVFAICFGYLLFREIPELYTIIGASIIIISTFAITYHETKQTKKEPILKAKSIELVST